MASLDTIKEVAQPLWQQLIVDNPEALDKDNPNNLDLGYPMGTMTFDDFCDEIRLSLG